MCRERVGGCVGGCVGAVFGVCRVGVSEACRVPFRQRLGLLECRNLGTRLEERFELVRRLEHFFHCTAGIHGDIVLVCWNAFGFIMFQLFEGYPFRE